MGDLKTYLPRLTVNSLFIEDLMSDNPPCFAFGYVEERGEKSGFIAPFPLETQQSDPLARPG